VLVVRGKECKERNVIVGEYAQRAIQNWLPIRAKWVAEHNLDTPTLLFSVGARRSVERLNVRSIGRVLQTVAKSKGA
jgi:site-specific recombinase XerD